MERPLIRRSTSHVYLAIEPGMGVSTLTVTEPPAGSPGCGQTTPEEAEEKTLLYHTLDVKLKLIYLQC